MLREHGQKIGDHVRQEVAQWATRHGLGSAPDVKALEEVTPKALGDGK